MKRQYVQYGCGLSAPNAWINFDSSPTLRIQKIPLFGLLFRQQLNTVFPDNILVGDIVRGLPIENNSCDGIYCSHVLEHLSYEDFKIAIKNTYVILKTSGFFRLVMPDLEELIKNYNHRKNINAPEASIIFMKHSKLGLEKSGKGFMNQLTNAFGNSRHQWMWDKDAAIMELKQAGFRNILCN